MSYEIDNRIREGSDFDKLLASYDRLVKTAEFTQKKVKNITLSKVLIILITACILLT